MLKYIGKFLDDVLLMKNRFAGIFLFSLVLITYGVICMVSIFAIVSILISFWFILWPFVFVIFVGCIFYSLDAFVEHKRNK